MNDAIDLFDFVPLKSNRIRPHDVRIWRTLQLACVENGREHISVSPLVSYGKAVPQQRMHSGYLNYGVCHSG
jgi:hypothetical protein